MNETLTRRNFVAGAALAGAGVAAAASLAGTTSAQAQDALTAEGNPAWLGEAPEVAEADITETLETEFLSAASTPAVCPARFPAHRTAARPSSSSVTPRRPASRCARTSAP